MQRFRGRLVIKAHIFCVSLNASLGSYNEEEEKEEVPCAPGADGDFNPTEGPSWGHSKVVLGAIRSLLEPFVGIYRQKLTRSLKN